MSPLWQGGGAHFVVLQCWDVVALVCPCLALSLSCPRSVLASSLCFTLAVSCIYLVHTYLSRMHVSQRASVSLVPEQVAVVRCPVHGIPVPYSLSYRAFASIKYSVKPTRYGVVRQPQFRRGPVTHTLHTRYTHVTHTLHTCTRTWATAPRWLGTASI